MSPIPAGSPYPGSSPARPFDVLDEIVRLTSDLIRFPSLHSRPDAIRECGRFVMDYCDRHGMAAEWMEHEGIPSILVLPEPGRAKLLLLSHIDVVDATDDLFQPRIDGDILYGRGAGDDKYAVALSLVLFRERLRALEAAGTSRKDMALGLLITGDEEIGGANGAAKALPRISTDYVIALDGGSPESVVLLEKGILDLRLTRQGGTAHGAQPWLGDNAIEGLMADVAAIKTLFPGDAPEHWHRSVNLGKIRAGESINQVPGLAEGWLDIRYTEADDPDVLLADIRAIVKSEVTEIHRVPVFTSPPSRWTDRLLAISGASPGREHGASDASYLSANGMTGIVWGAEVFDSLHTAGECVSISSIGRLAGWIRQLAVEMEERHR